MGNRCKGGLHEEFRSDTVLVVLLCTLSHFYGVPWCLRAGVTSYSVGIHASSRDDGNIPYLAYLAVCKKNDYMGPETTQYSFTQSGLAFY